MENLQNDVDSKRGRHALGRGLSSLIPTGPIGDLSTTTGLLQIPIESLQPNRSQPRQIFEEGALSSLAASIQTHGILQPLIVRKHQEGYEIVAGERRWRAAQRAELKTVPCVVAEIADNALLTVALVENIQRQDLNAIEEAESYRRLTEELGLTQEQISQAVGRERSTIANFLRLLKLPTEIQQLVVAGQLTMGHARALLALENIQQILSVATQVVVDGLNVRQTERLIQDLSRQGDVGPEKRARKQQSLDSPAEREIRRQLEHNFGSRVELRQHQGKGMIVIHFASVQELNSILDKCNVSL